MAVTVYPRGTTLYRPERCFEGYQLILLPAERATLGLVDMQGRPVHTWTFDGDRPKDAMQRARLLPNGRLLVLRTVPQGAGAIEEYAWDGTPVFRYEPPDPLRPHHDVEKTADGNWLIICREEVPESVRRRAKEPERRRMLYADVLQEISPEGQVVWEWHQYEHIAIDRCVRVPAPADWWAGPENNTLVDWTHTNTIQALPENRWYDAGDARFKPGNVLHSLRQLDVLLLVDRDSGEIAWEYTGDYHGGMSGQHDSHMIEKGLPGEGHVLIFDNGASPSCDLSHCGASYILEVDPTTDRVVWVYDKGEAFHANFTSSCQRLPNGNTLILEAINGRLFEVTPECETVWEHIFEGPIIQRAYRYGPGHCPQLAEIHRTR